MRRGQAGITGVLIAVAVLVLGASAAEGAATGIEGTVSALASVEEVEVCVVEVLPSETCTYPHADGEYKLLGLNPGTYQVEFLPSYASHLITQYYNNKAKLSEASRVVVSVNTITEHINANLQLGGEIEGRVTAALGGLGLEEVEVCAQDASSQAAVSCTHTDAEGNYALPSIPPGSYRIGFWGEGKSAAYAPQYYNAKPSFFEATNVAVGAGATITGIGAQLQLGAQVSGAVTDSASGDPLAGIAVCILKSSAAGPERCTYTGASGSYSFEGLASGTYQVAFSPEFSEFAKEEFVLPEEDGWHTQYYAGSATREGSTSLSLSAPQQRQGVDAALLTTAPPPSPPPPAITPDTAIPASAIVSLPPEKKKPKKCRKGYRKQKAGGKMRCVKAHGQRGKGKKTRRARR